MNALAEVIRREILGRGPISFSRFMEMALYYPNLGYYERPTGGIGRRGDFFTSVSVGCLFGELLAFQFAEWLDELRPVASAAAKNLGESAQAVNQPGSELAIDPDLLIVEAGAHDGCLGRDILSWFRRHRTDLFEKLEYCIVEPSLVRRNWQEQTLRAFESRVRWIPSWEAFSGRRIHGVIFANELLDSFPVQRLGWDARNGEWFEWGVTCQENHFIWMRIPDSTKPGAGAASRCLWPKLPQDLLAALPDGFTTEVSSAAATWWHQAAGTLARGKLLTIDYGFDTEQFFVPERADGTLRAYHQHRANSDLLDRVGEQDLTSHVNFTMIQRAGEQAGLQTEALVSQSKLLTGVLRKIELSPQRFDPWTPARIRQFQTLTHPEHLGRPFQALIQSR